MLKSLIHTLPLPTLRSHLSPLLHLPPATRHKKTIRAKFIYIYTCLENTCNHITKLSWTEGVLVFFMEQIYTIQAITRTIISNLPLRWLSWNRRNCFFSPTRFVKGALSCLSARHIAHNWSHKQEQIVGVALE